MHLRLRKCQNFWKMKKLLRRNFSKYRFTILFSNFGSLKNEHRDVYTCMFECVWERAFVWERERVQGWQQYEREIFGIRAINSPPPNNINPLLSYYIVNNAEVKRKTRWGFWHLTLPFVCQRKEWIEQKKFDNWNIFQCNKTWLLQIEVLRLVKHYSIC